MPQVSEILAFLDNSGYACAYDGDPALAISGFCQLSNLKDGCITWAKHPDRVDPEAFAARRGMLLVTGEKPEGLGHTGVIVCPSPKAAFFSTVRRFFCPARAAAISPHAVIETEHIGQNVSIGHFSYLGPEVVVGDDVVIGQHVSIECPAVIGKGSVIGSGVVIGTDGYGYYADAAEVQRRVPHLGGVQIGAYVDIGANTCVDRGTIGDTIIEDHAKIDNLCHIAHNAHIKRHAMVVALSMLAGSTTVGEKAYIAPGAMVLNQKTVGDGSMVGMGAVVFNDVPEGKLVIGVPARVFGDRK